MEERRQIDGFLALHEVIERLALLRLQHALAHAARRQREDLVEEDFVDARAIFRELVLELAAVFRLGADGVDDELDIWQPLHEHLRPGRDAADDVRIRALGQQADFHSTAPFQYSRALSPVMRTR